MTDNKSNKRVFFLHQRETFTYKSMLDFGKPCRREDLHQAEHTGGRTIAYSYDENGVTYAVAKVNDKDRYVKATGRKVSSERLAAGGKDVGYYPGSVDKFRAIMDADFAIHRR